MSAADGGVSRSFSDTDWVFVLGGRTRRERSFFVRSLTPTWGSCWFWADDRDVSAGVFRSSHSPSLEGGVEVFNIRQGDVVVFGT